MFFNNSSLREVNATTTNDLSGKGEISIAVFSDTHGKTQKFERALSMADRLCGGLQFALHAGDCVADIGLIKKAFPSCQIFNVRGNNDFDCRETPSELIIEFGETKIFMTHGHQFHYANLPMNLYYKASELNAKIAVFGHTHRMMNADHCGVTLLNPGSVSLPKDGTQGSFAIIKISGSNVCAEIFTLGK